MHPPPSETGPLCKTLFYAAISQSTDPASLCGLLEPMPCILHAAKPEASKEGFAAYRGSVKGKLIRCLEDIYSRFVNAGGT